jgi:hypothetical protein
MARFLNPRRKVIHAPRETGARVACLRVLHIYPRAQIRIGLQFRSQECVVCRPTFVAALRAFSTKFIK